MSSIPGADITDPTVSVEHLRINHYPIKSREELGKKARLKKEKKRYDGIDYFAYHDRNEVLAPILARYLPHLGLAAPASGAAASSGI